MYLNSDQEYRDVQIPSNISSFKMDTINLKFIGVPQVFIKSMEYDFLRGLIFSN